MRTNAIFQTTDISYITDLSIREKVKSILEKYPNRFSYIYTTFCKWFKNYNVHTFVDTTTSEPFTFFYNETFYAFIDGFMLSQSLKDEKKSKTNN